MSDSDLDKRLKSAKGPTLPADYVDDFPRLVLAGLRSAPQTAFAGAPRHSWRPRLAWGLATIACVLVAFAAGHWHGRKAAKQDVLANARLIEETLAMFPNRVRAIVQDERGMNLVLSDQPDVPTSTPIYVRICDGRNCSSLVTFSGQEVQIAGQKITVLSDATGGIILEGNAFAWSSSGGGETGQRMKIQARLLKTQTL